MGLRKMRLGNYIEQLNDRNENRVFDKTSVRGLSTQKQYTETKADLNGVNLSGYKLFPPGTFAYVPDTSRRGDKVSLAFNGSNDTFLVSSISIVFEVTDKASLCPEYLFMYFNRPEFDRYARYNSWGSARETFSWDDMSDIEIDLPDIETQRKYAQIYKAIQANQRCHEQGLDDLKLACDAYIENLKSSLNPVRIGNYIEEYDSRNPDGLSVQFVKGISTDKQFIETKADMDGVSVSNYKVVQPGMLAFVADTSRRGDRISLALNSSQEPYLVSTISIVFRTDEKLDPRYLMLYLSRSEFDRYARFHSWGSARETFTFDDMQDVMIPIPDINIQRSIADVYNAYRTRREINERLKSQLKDICPILIKGSIEEARIS